ncbi:DUF892 family protein [Chitinispirillales bacterium ANBcel5]|uniref:DUF892 family protein n=1 Tax=Cellulosispirillum alkaliphilum TaxID=3039283 RepID=UPI002A57C089|nr:DUF892 family protein [Chitinispirillales bacterium ANBcel5]
MRLNSLEDLLQNQILKLYNSELQISQILPVLTEASYSSDLRQTFLAHLRRTEEQMKRLEKVLKILNVEHDGEWCIAAEGLLNECKELFRVEADPAVKDTALIYAAQRLTQYEVSCYCAAHTSAREIGYDEVAEILEEILEEECGIDKQLNSLAKGGFFSIDSKTE